MENIIESQSHFNSMSRCHHTPCCVCGDPTLYQTQVYSFKTEYVLRLVLERFLYSKNPTFCDEELGLNDTEWDLIATLRHGISISHLYSTNTYSLKNLKDLDRICQESFQSILHKSDILHSFPSQKDAVNLKRYHNLLVETFLFAIPFTARCLDTLPDPPQALFNRVVQRLLEHLKSSDVLSWIRHLLTNNGYRYPCCSCSGGSLTQHIQQVHAWKLDVIVRNILERSLYSRFQFQDQEYGLTEREGQLLETLSRHLETPYEVSLEEVQIPEDIVSHLKDNLERILNGAWPGVTYEGLLLESLMYTANLAARCMERFKTTPQFNPFSYFKLTFELWINLLEKKKVLRWLRHSSTDPVEKRAANLFQKSEVIPKKNPLSSFYSKSRCSV